MTRTIRISVQRTVQVERFEPVSVTVEETVQVRNEDEVAEARMELYKDVTRAVKKFVDNEVAKYSDGKGKEKRRGDD